MWRTGRGRRAPLAWGFLSAVALVVVLFPSGAVATGVGEWSNAAEPDLRRVGTGVVTLADGRVLVAAGTLEQPDCCGYAGQAEIYDPPTDSWSPAGNQPMFRFRPVAARLNDGTVLFAAGDANNCNLPSAGRTSETYDPSTNTWTTAGLLNSRRGEPAWAVLQDGRVLVAGGNDGNCGGGGNAIHTSAEIFDPATRQWTPAASMPMPRAVDRAVTLDDGRVLLVGGYDLSGPLPSAVTYDPLSNTWSTVTSPSEVHGQGSLVKLSDGRVLVAGGQPASFTYTGGEVFDPGTDTWSATGPMRVARSFHHATLLADGRVLVVGGLSGDTPTTFARIRDAEIFDPTTNTWEVATSMQRVHDGFTPGAAPLPDGRVLVLGLGNPFDADGYVPEIFDLDAVATPVAQADSGYLPPGAGGGTALESVFSNDDLRPGTPTAATATLTTVGSVPAGISLDLSDGSVDVQASVQPGSYAFDYELCEVAFPSRCDTATVTVLVDAPRPIAANDTGSVDSEAGGTAVADVLANDTLGDGVTPATLSNVNLFAGFASPGLSLDTGDGSVDAVAGMAPGSYFLRYTICEQSFPSNCASADVSVTVTSSQLEITDVTEVADTVPRYARFEASFQLSETFDNPFDPAEIAVDVTFTAPSGGTQTVPAFWYQPFTVAGSPDFEQYVPAADPGWRIRFAPDEVGTYAYSIAAVAGSDAATPVTGSFQSTASARSGFVRVDDRNPRYLRYDNDAPYLPVGHNVAFEDFPPLNGTGYYSNLFSSLDTAGENWTRVWMTDFNRSALEWGTGHYSGFYDGPGEYSLPSAWRMDRILELAEQHGLAVQLVLNDHGQFSTWVNARWQVRCAESDAPPCQPGDEGYDPGNAYSTTNGGPVDAAAPQEFFSNAEARELFKQRLRYLVGRYGAYTSLLAWELFNEVQFIGTNAINAYGDAGVRADIVSWHQEMSDYLSSIDPHEHLVTTSSWDPTATPDLWSLPNLDVVQIHTYSSPPTNRTTEIRDLVAQLKSSLGKPVLVGELGIGSGDPEAGFNPATFGGTTPNREHLVEGTHLHNALWAGALSESGAAYWWWGIYMSADPSKNRTPPKFPLNQRHVPPLNAYLAGEDWAPLGLDTASLSVSGDITAVGVNSSSRAFLWVRDTENEYGTGARPGDLAGRSIVGASVDVTGMDDGRYQVRVYDTWGAGGVTSTFEAEAAGGTLSVPLPAFTRDVALKVDFAGPVGRRTEDAADDLGGKQVHLVYAIPWDGDDRELDLDGTIAESVGVAQTWLAGQTGGRSFRVDTVNGEPDITFFQLARTDEELADEGPFVRDAIEEELVAAGFVHPDKIYVVHYDGTSTFACGGAAWPPTLAGTVAALYLHGLPDGPAPCDGNPFASSGGQPGYWEYSWLHEIVHTLGFVAQCAPNHTLGGHVSEPNNDLMWAGTTGFWDLNGVVLDEGNDDYFGHDGGGCLDLAESPFLADVVQEVVPPGGTVTTDPNGDGPSPTDPVEASVTTPNGGSVTIDEGNASGAPPAGFTFLGQQVVIEAPSATAGTPLRLVFSIHPSLVPAGESAQTLQIFRDGVLVGECPGSTTASPNPCIAGRLELGDGTARITVLTSQASTWNLGVSGSAVVASCSSTPPPGAIVGSARGEKLTGNGANNVIFGLGGDDTIDGGGGHDVICGGEGRDRIIGGGGNDAVDGGPGADQLDGGAGDDRLVGSDANDSVTGGPGNDTADGGPGTDTLDGGPGTDTCRGERLKGCER